ncbi:MAG: GAF domain-containing protein [Nitrospirota bacterium]
MCKILIPRDSHEFLYLVAGFGWRPGLIGSLTVEGGRHSQAGYAIRERQPVLVRNLRIETRFTPSKRLTDHHIIAGMSVPVKVQDRVNMRDSKKVNSSAVLISGSMTLRWLKEETNASLIEKSMFAVL